MTYSVTAFLLAFVAASVIGAAFGLQWLLDGAMPGVVGRHVHRLAPTLIKSLATSARALDPAAAPRRTIPGDPLVWLTFSYTRGTGHWAAVRRILKKVRPVLAR